jgi:hypothetical protein
VEVGKACRVGQGMVCKHMHMKVDSMLYLSKDRDISLVCSKSMAYKDTHNIWRVYNKVEESKLLYS